jgi:hypothetical protein
LLYPGEFFCEATHLSRIGMRKKGLHNQAGRKQEDCASCEKNRGGGTSVELLSFQFLKIVFTK